MGPPMGHHGSFLSSQGSEMDGGYYDSSRDMLQNLISNLHGGQQSYQSVAFYECMNQFMNDPMQNTPEENAFFKRFD
jgi:hypothetical protein